MKQSSFRYRLLVAASLFISFGTVNAVEVTARIKGTVTDPTGAVIRNAQVTAINIDTGVIISTTTSSIGDYIFQKLPIGIYNISVSASGFVRYTAMGIILYIDQEYALPIKLSVGSSAETVEVRADTVQVNTTDMQLSNIVDSKQITELPLIGRAFTNLELILPGVQAPSDRFNSSVNGSQSQQSAFVINGADTNDPGLNTIFFQPNVDALQEFNLITGPMNAEYGRNSGAIISAAIKQGTNRVHGTAFDFYRDTFLNTRNYFQKNPITLPTPTFHQNIFGGTVGGPILHDKLFAFGSYEGLRQTIPQSGGNVTVFTAAQLAGNYTSSVFPTNKFSAKVIPATINIPGCASGKDTFATCLARLQGVVPASAFNPISANFAKAYIPAPNTGSNVYTFSPTQTNSADQYIGRFDFDPTQVNQFYFVGVNENDLQSSTLAGASIPGFGARWNANVYQFSAGWTHAFDSTAVNDLGIHYTRLNSDSYEPQNVVAPSSLGFSISPQNTASQSVPNITLLGADTSQPSLTLGFATNAPQPHINQAYQANDSFAKTFGHHNLKFGYDWRKFAFKIAFYNNNNGAFAFNTSNGYSSGNVALDFLLGIPATYAQSSGSLINVYAYLNYLYVQDTWKAAPSLTLSYGLGYQIDTPFYNLQYGGIGITCFISGQQSTILSTAPVGLSYPGDPGCNNASGATTKYFQLGPRLGFAWTPELGILSGGFSKKLSIRGGYGIYYNRTEAEPALQTNIAPPFGVNSKGAVDYGVASNPSFANPYQDLNVAGPAGSYPNKFPFVPPSAGATPSFDVFKPFSLTQFNPAFRSPYSENVNSPWNVNFQVAQWPA